MRTISKKIVCLFLTFLLGTLIFSVEVKAEDASQPLYTVQYGYSRIDDPGQSTEGAVSFNNINDLRSWINDILANKSSGSFSYAKVTLGGDADVFFFNSNQLIFDFNNYNFRFVDNAGKPVSYITIDRDISMETEFRNGTFSGNVQWVLQNRAHLFLSNIVLDGGNKVYYNDIILLQADSSISGESVTIKDFDLRDRAKIITIFGSHTDNYHIYYAAMGMAHGGPFQFVNIHSDNRDGIICLEEDAHLACVQFISCSSANGGAVKLANGTIDECTFKNCSAKKGGAVYALGGKIILSTFENNTATDSNGGAVYVNCEDFEISDSSFIGNSSSDDGGAVYVMRNYFTLNNCTFENNHSDDDGGAIYIYPQASNCVIKDSKFSGNSADGKYDDVRGGSNVKISNCGAIISSGSTIIIIIACAILLVFAVVYILVKFRFHKSGKGKENKDSV